MYRGSRYDKMNVKYSDVFDGISGYLFVILSISTIIYIFTTDGEISVRTQVYLLIFSFVDILCSIFWTIHLITYSKSVKEYEATQKIKRKINLVFMGTADVFSIVLLATNFGSNYIVSYLVMSQLIISFFRIVNYYVSYVRDGW